MNHRHASFWALVVIAVAVVAAASTLAVAP